MIKFSSKKKEKKSPVMLPETLTESQEDIPSLTKMQLNRLGYETNHVWKLNARMLGFLKNLETNEYPSIDDFIDSIKGDKIKSNKKGKQVSLFCFEGKSPEILDDFPLAFEGDFIISQRYEMENEEWQELEFFTVKEDTPSLISCYVLPFGLTGNFRIVYGKYFTATSTPTTLIESKEID